MSVSTIALSTVSSVISSSSSLLNLIFVEPTIITTMPIAAGLTQGITPLFDIISWQAVYLAGTAIVGMMILYAARKLKANAGKIPHNTAFNVSSIMETVWFVISGIALYFADFTTLPKVIAVAYTLYSVFGWIYGFFLLKDQDIKPTDVDDIDDVPMPAKYMDYSQSFALVIILAALAFLGYLYYQGVFSFVQG